MTTNYSDIEETTPDHRQNKEVMAYFAEVEKAVENILKRQDKFYLADVHRQLRKSGVDVWREWTPAALKIDIIEEAWSFRLYAYQRKEATPSTKPEPRWNNRPLKDGFADAFGLEVV